MLMVLQLCEWCLVHSVHKTPVASQPQPSTMSGLPQCMPSIDMQLLVESTDQLGMDSDDLVPTLTVRYCHLCITTV